MSSDQFDNDAQIKLNLTITPPTSHPTFFYLMKTLSDAASVAVVLRCCPLVEIWRSEGGGTASHTGCEAQDERDEEQRTNGGDATLFLLLARLIRRTPMPWRTNFMEVRRLSSTAGCQRSKVKFINTCRQMPEII